MISIIVPAYQAEKTVADSIRSVLAQSFQDWELIVIDDCSADNTCRLVEELKKSLPRETGEKIRLIKKQKNTGVSESRNLGAEMAQGDWIAFLDSDDLWTTDKLEKQMQLLAAHPDAGILFTGSAFIRENGDRSSYVLQVPKEITYRKLLRQNLISCSSVVMRRELFLRHRMQHDELHEDFLLWLKLLREGVKAYGVNEPLLIYRLSPASKSGNKLHAARMTWRVYRHMGLGFGTSLSCLVSYTLRNTLKYRRIYKGFAHEGRS